MRASFPEAIATFAAFLASEGVPTQLLWVDREDVTSYRRQIWVRVNNATEAARRAAASAPFGGRLMMGRIRRTG